MEEKRKLPQIDYIYLATLLVLLIFSALVQYSASYGINPDAPFSGVQKHIFTIVTGLALFLVMAFINYRDYRPFIKVFFAAMLLILILVLIPGIGAVRNNARSWFDLKVFSIQPSEFAKILYIVVFADYLARHRGKIQRLVDFIPPFIMLLVPVLLILRQPDLGTVLVYFAIFFIMMFVAGANPKILLPILFGGLFLVILVLFLHYQFGLPLPLEDYQLMRFTVFIDPYNDGKGGLGPGYNIIQSLIAIGSGGLYGKGFMQGTQVQSNFLPYHHTDFIYSVIGEEFGFIGSVLVLVLFFFLLYRAILIAKRSYDFYGALIISGIVGMIFFHIMVSAGMAIGVMPITGIPFPLFSSGGSSMWSNMAALGLVLSVDLHKKTFRF